MCSNPHGTAWCPAAYAQTEAFKGTEEWRQQKAKLLTFPLLTVGALQTADPAAYEAFDMLATQTAPGVEVNSLPIALLVPAMEELMSSEFFCAQCE